MNATLDTSPQSAQPTPDSSTYPPTLSDTVRELALELLRTVKPELDVQTTWLAYRDSTLPPDAEDSVYSAPLIASLIEHFTGRLSWNDNEVQGFYPTPSPSAQTFVINPLPRTAILTLFAEVNEQLEQRYTRELADYWGAALQDGKTRSSEFLAERVHCLKSECEIRVALGEMTTRHFTMLSAALKPCAAGAVDEFQPHSIYGVSASLDGREPIALSGAFAITRTLRTLPLEVHEDVQEDVLLFTLNNGLEAFTSFKQMNDTLVQRGTDPEYRQQLRAELAPAESTQAVSALQWHYTALGGHFLSLLLTRQIIKQKSLFAQAAQLARAGQMDADAFEQLNLRLLAPGLHFNNQQHLHQLDADLIYTHMPDWWKSMGQAQREAWLEQARRLGEAVVKIQHSGKDYFNQPGNDSRRYLTHYIDHQLNQALKQAAIRLEPEQIVVTLTYRVRSWTIEIPGTPEVPDKNTTRMSLAQLVRNPTHRARVRDAVQIDVVDETGAALTRLDTRAIKELVETINSPEHLTEYLDVNLKSSTYAHQLKQSQKNVLEAQMKMALLEIDQQAFPLTGSSWIKAVLNAPSPDKRSTVNGERIEVRFFSVNQLKMTNVMLIAPQDRFDKGPLVLCTLDAPDGVVFRWFNSMFHLNTRFLEETSFQRYLIQQIPVSRRLETLHAMNYEKQARHWRVPDIFTRLSPIPIPDKLLRPVVFIPQSKDFYEENHEAKINLLIQEIKQRMGLTPGAGQSGSFDIVASIALLFLPTPIMIPIALGLGLLKTWSAFSKIQDNDLEGAAEEFLSAIGYLSTAAIGRAGAYLKPAMHLAAKVRRPHLIRRVGRDGQVQIGYLMSHLRAPRFADSGVTVALDSKDFLAIELGTERCYVSRRANMFGHSRLYRPHPTDAALLVHKQEYVLRSTSGAWKAVGNEIPRISQLAIRQARSRLSQLLTDWPASFEEASAAERLQFETDYMALSKASNAEGLPAITSYAEGGSGEINPLLRAGVRNARTRSFLSQFYRLKEWHGDAFRATYVTSEGLACLERETGAVFMDNGVQSASVSRANAVRWSQDGFVTHNANADNHPVFFIFAPSVPKKNMFTGFLGDHVAVPPGTLLQLRATNKINGQLYAYFDIPEQLVDQTYDLYSGEKEWWV